MNSRARATSPPSQSTHVLDSPWPEFLDLLDADPQRALEGFHVFAWKLLVARPPAVLRSLERADREDRIADLVVSCCDDDFRKLRKYRNVGKPFSAWLTTVFVHQLLTWFRARRPTGELTDIPVEYEPPATLSTRVTECVIRCLGQLTEKCRTYLACVADGMKPREIALLLRLPEGDNKRVSDDLRHCMRRLRELLLAEGVKPEELFEKSTA